MKLTLDIKNMSRAINPKPGDVIVYDNEKWYITTKEDILKENLMLLNDCKEQLKEMKQLKKDVAAQLLDMSELIKKLYSK